jgi:SPP1 gp7 family putative phage head morphogenesis protein
VIVRTKLEATVFESYAWDWWERYGPDVMAALEAPFFEAALGGGLDEPQARILARQYARARGGELLQVDGSVNIVSLTRARVGALVADAIERGDSLQAVQKTLRADFAFSRERAVVVSRTESATALGQGSMGAAISQGRDEKRWVTQGDADVTPECAANEDQGWIPITDPFQSNNDTIPVHPNCRCTVIYRRSPPVEPEIAASFAPEVRCPSCKKLLGQNVAVGTVIRCRRCKGEATA